MLQLPYVNFSKNWSKRRFNPANAEHNTPTRSFQLLTLRSLANLPKSD